MKFKLIKAVITLKCLISFSRWDTLAEFETSHPLPCLKIKLLKESTGPLALDNKELGRVRFFYILT